MAPKKKNDQLTLKDLQRLGLADNRYAASTAESMRQMEQQGAALRESIDRGLAEFNAQQGGGDSGGGNAAPTGPTAEEIYYRNLAEQQTQEAIGILRDALRMYGLEGLVGDVDRIVRDSGGSGSVAMNKIRQTQAYKDRFKGLLSLQQKGVTDIANEAEYINLESQYRQQFREAGLQNFLGGAGTTAERDAIAKLVGDFSVSVSEVRNRIDDAQRVVAETPQEVRDSLQRFYNVDPATLTAYVLDPQRTSSEIQRRANAAIVGGYAQRAGLDFGAGVSERIGELLGGERDITGTQIEPQLTQISQVQKATGRLAQLEKGTLTAEETALAELDLDASAKQKVRGLQSRERARFGGTSGITAGSLSRAPSV